MALTRLIPSHYQLFILVFFFQNEEILIQLDELDRITHAGIGFNYSPTQAQKTFLCNRQSA